jgi:hypothetical protein
MSAASEAAVMAASQTVWLPRKGVAAASAA